MRAVYLYCRDMVINLNDKPKSRNIIRTSKTYFEVKQKSYAVNRMN